jgi:hypothetical protein
VSRIATYSRGGGFLWIQLCSLKKVITNVNIEKYINNVE